MAHTPRNIYWVGPNGVPVTYTNPNYWSTSRGGAGGNGVATPDGADTGFPDAGDSVFIQGSTSQFAGSDQSAISLGNLYVDGKTTTIPPFPPLSMGSPGSPLKLTVANNGTAQFTGPYGDLYVGITMGGSGTMVLFQGTGNANLGGVSASGAGVIVAQSGVLNVASDYGGSYALHGTGGNINVDQTALSGTPTATMDTGNLSCGRTLGASSLDGQGASATLWGTAAIASMTCRAGAYLHNSTGTVTYIETRPGAIATAGAAPFTVTNATVYGGVLFPNAGNVTYSNPVKTFSYFPGGRIPI